MLVIPALRGGGKRMQPAESVFKKTNQKPAKIKIKENKGHKSPTLTYIDRWHN